MSEPEAKPRKEQAATEASRNSGVQTGTAQAEGLGFALEFARQSRNMNCWVPVAGSGGSRRAREEGQGQEGPGQVCKSG